MSKTKETVIDDQNQEQQPQTRMLTAAISEELFQQVEDLKASLREGQTLTAGAVARNEYGNYTIQIDIINN